MPGFEIFGEEEKAQVNDVLESGILMRYNFDGIRNNHWKTRELESEISEKIGVKFVHVTSSGTTALITAMNALEVGAGDEIIMPSFTFVASFEAVLAVGAIPVLVDVDDTLTLSPSAIEKAITPKTKAIMPVHMCGAMADLDAILAIAKKHNLLVIEDACQATGATYNGKYLGTIGDIGAYSFDFVKTVTCGEGGAVFTNDEKIYDHIHQFTDHGHDHIGNDRGAESHPVIGLNYRISELGSAVGLAQWRKLDMILDIQRKNKSYIKTVLKTIPEVKFRRIPDESGDNASFLSLFLPTENQARQLASDLKLLGIASAYWYDNNWHYIRKWEHLKNIKTLAPLYEEHRNSLPDYENQDFTASDEVMSKAITLPISLLWKQEDLEQKAMIIKNAILKILA